MAWSPFARSFQGERKKEMGISLRYTHCLQVDRRQSKPVHLHMSSALYEAAAHSLVSQTFYGDE